MANPKHKERAKSEKSVQLSHHNPEATDIFPEQRNNVYNDHHDRQRQITQEDDFIVIVLRGSKQICQERHSSFY